MSIELTAEQFDLLVSEALDGIPAELAAFPHALVGSVEEICATLERRREAYGLSYVTVGNAVADAFAPEAWANGRPDSLFNHLSSGPQICAGVDVLLFMAKSVIATSRLRPSRRVRLAMRGISGPVRVRPG